MLKDMFAISHRKKFARQLLEPLIEKEIKKRKRIRAVSDKQMAKGLKEVLEEISDSIDRAPTGDSTMPV